MTDYKSRASGEDEYDEPIAGPVKRPQRPVFEEKQPDVLCDRCQTKTPYGFPCLGCLKLDGVVCECSPPEKEHPGKKHFYWRGERANKRSWHCEECAKERFVCNGFTGDPVKQIKNEKTRRWEDVKQ